MISDQHDPRCKKDGCELIPMCVASRSYAAALALAIAVEALAEIRKYWKPGYRGAGEIVDPFTVADTALKSIKKLPKEGF